MLWDVQLMNINPARGFETVRVEAGTEMEARKIAADENCQGRIGRILGCSPASEQPLDNNG